MSTEEYVPEQKYDPEKIAKIQREIERQYPDDHGFGKMFAHASAPFRVVIVPAPVKKEAKK